MARCFLPNSAKYFWNRSFYSLPFIDRQFLILKNHFNKNIAELGLGIMLVCVILCCLNTFFTVLCVSAIVTNGRVKNGGNYYMIARTLGPAFGGSVAVCYFYICFFVLFFKFLYIHIFIYSFFYY